MLKKLIRHEFAETWKIPVLIFAAGAVVSLACALYFYLQPAPASDVEMNAGNLTVYLFFVFLTAAVSLFLSLYFGVRFYKNMYTDEGYFMHTLPVRPWMLLTAKAVAGSIFSYFGTLLVLFTIFPVTFIAVPKIAYTEPAEMEEVLRMFGSLFGNSLLSTLFYLIPYALVSSVSGILLIYAAICLGQLFGRHKVLSSILCYLGLSALVSTISSIFVLPGLTGVTITSAQEAADSQMTAQQVFSVTFPSMLRTSFLASFLASIVICAAAFFLSNYLMTKCLNLD